MRNSQIDAETKTIFNEAKVLASNIRKQIVWRLLRYVLLLFDYMYGARHEHEQS